MRGVLLLKYMKKYWPFALLSMALMIGEVGIDMIQPKLMAQIVDNGILGLNNGGVPDLPLIWTIGVRMILIVLLGGVCGVACGACANLCSQNYGNELRKAAFTKIMHLSFEQTDRFTTGSLITRVTGDVSQVERLVQQSIRGFIRCLMFMVVGTMTLMSLNQHFLVIVACAFPLVLLSMSFILWKSNPLFTLVQEKLDSLNTVIQENIGGVRVVKAFVQEEREEARFRNVNEDLLNTQLTVLILMSWLRPIMNIILNLATVALIKIGAVQVQGGFMQPGEVMAAVTYISQILSGMMMLAMMFQMLSRGLASGKRIKEVLDSDPVIKSGSYRPEQESVGIEFRNVSFAYKGQKETILHDISLDIRPGETLAIVGATGCGKTTLVSLIPRFYDASSGQILINGVDVKDYDLGALRDRIAFVTQKNELFSTTIRDNLMLGNRNASEDEMRKAAVCAQAENFILEQSDGYDTPVAEGGMSLSGGQRQRVAIARALLKNAPVLILDDATSALDLATESRFYEALANYHPGITRIVIAQRISTARRADRIAVINNGTIEACGTHEELLSASPTYAEIAESQMKKGGAA